ncbi:hypothetical protein PVK06_008086 [Gossypium arboreum]|uniref:Uncharacterized protein n=1 Tax=Gossypium arboreum TaxID=29729 RepID=A0ABR0QJ12_GOSAR|nr:hypothetical protein PVK06_008086 [Gossypium arboreum]
MSDKYIDDTDQEMYIGDDESYDVDETESVTPSVNLVGNQQPNVERGKTRERDDSQLLRVIVETATATTSAPTIQRAPIKQLRKYGATGFLDLKRGWSVYSSELD